jgi:hypothetical protein
LQTVVGPVIPNGIGGAVAEILTAWQRCEVELHKLLAFTQMFPELVPKVTVILLVPFPVVMLASAGTVQL